jgi:hypothetical protein
LIVAPDAVSEDDIDKLIIPDDLPEEPSFKAYIEATVYDKEGRLIQHHKQPMRSLTQYFLALMSIPLIGTYSGGSGNSPTSLIVNVLGISGIPGQTNTANVAWTWSIQVGSGTQAFSPTLKGLAAPIANGTGAGQLVYSTTAVSYIGSSIIVFGSVSNSTSSTISVTEIGLTCTINITYMTVYGYGGDTYNCLLSYDTFSTAISIPAGGAAAFQITISFTG